jgi:1,4-alpha-glucan branching enzyme
VWSPESVKVEILVIETEQVIALEQKDMGNWFIQTDLLKPGNKYRILLNGEKEFPDPASLNQADGVHGASKQWTCRVSMDRQFLDKYSAKELYHLRIAYRYVHQ